MCLLQSINFDAVIEDIKNFIIMKNSKVSHKLKTLSTYSAHKTFSLHVKFLINAVL